MVSDQDVRWLEIPINDPFLVAVLDGDPYLACALAARASFIISRDPDLLTLDKPFGVEILTPRAHLSRAAGSPA